VWKVILWCGAVVGFIFLMGVHPHHYYPPVGWIGFGAWRPPLTKASCFTTYTDNTSYTTCTPRPRWYNQRDDDDD
jgi:hypothetical protein